MKNENDLGSQINSQSLWANPSKELSPQLHLLSLLNRINENDNNFDTIRKEIEDLASKIVRECFKDISTNISAEKKIEAIELMESVKSLLERIAKVNQKLLVKISPTLKEGQLIAPEYVILNTVDLSNWCIENYVFNTYVVEANWSNAYLNNVVFGENAFYSLYGIAKVSNYDNLKFKNLTGHDIDKNNEDTPEISEEGLMDLLAGFWFDRNTINEKDEEINKLKTEIELLKGKKQDTSEMDITMERFETTTAGSLSLG